MFVSSILEYIVEHLLLPFAKSAYVYEVWKEMFEKKAHEAQT